MITIIELGYGNKTYRLRCLKCKCLFECEDEDIKIVGPPCDKTVEINCPWCHQKLCGWDINDLLNQYK